MLRLAHITLLALSTILAWTCNAQFTASRNFFPPAYPLAVRSPYLNAWIAPTNNNGTTLSSSWPVHWDDNSIMGIGGYAKVDGNPYRWMAFNTLADPTTLVSAEVTPTRTKFTIQAGAVQLDVTFLSPIEPNDWVLQSLPFIYVSVDVTSTDGSPHNVQVYLDTSAEWLSGDRGNIAQWETKDIDDVVYHKATLSQPSSMVETNNIATDSTLYFGMASTNSSTWQTGGHIDIRNLFIKQGRLNDTRDTNFRPINDNFIVFAHTFDFGNITNSTTPAVWSLGLIRDPVIAYNSLNNRFRSPYWRTRFEDGDDAAKSFITGFKTAVNSADALDAKIMANATSNYADLVAIGLRQTMAGIDITVPRAAGDNWNLSDVKGFMRDTGFSQRINPVEGLFAAFPAFLYLNSSLGGILLDSLLEFQSLNGDREFAASDLGSQYPQVAGSPLNSNQALESTGNMLIMALAHAQVSGDGNLVARYYTMLKRWTDYLSGNTLMPENQFSYEVKTSNQSNLAIKGIIGIAAMAKISKALNQESDFRAYSASASALYAQWKTLAISDGHITSIYGQTQSTPLVYNLYADVLLQTNVVDSSVYSQQTQLYDTLSTNPPPFGLPFDDTIQSGVAHAPWTIFTAATTQNVTRDRLIDMVHKKASFNGTRGNFPAMYQAGGGGVFAGPASPAQGAMFAILALSLPIRPIVASISPASDVPRATRSNGNGGKIVGAVIGSLVGVGLLVLGLLFWRRRRKNLRQEESLTPIPFDPNLFYRQRVPDDVAMNPIYQNQPHAGVRFDDARSNFSVPESEEPEFTDLSSPISHQHSQSVTTSNWSSTVRTGETSNLRHEIAALRQQMSELQAHQEVLSLRV